jgi:hypothetical protein
MHLHVDATKFSYEKKYIQIVHTPRGETWGSGGAFVHLYHNKAEIL